MKNWSYRVENQVRTLLRSHGLLFFTSGSASGLVFLVAIFSISSLAGAAAVIGALVASFAARLVGADRKLIEDGLYGYNGVLAGLGALSFVTPASLVPEAAADPGWPLMLAVAAAASSGLLMHAWMRSGVVDRPGLPALTLPSIVGIWLWGKIFVALGLLELSADAVFPGSVDPGWYGLDGLAAAFGKWVELGLPHLPVAVLLLLGYAMEQPRRIPAVALSVVAALSVGGLVLGPWASEYPGYTFYTATPLVLALGLLFFVPGLRSVLLAILALFVAAPVWERLGLVAEQLELPLLTLPFSVVVFGFVALARLLPRRLARLLPEPVPLHRVGVVDSTRLGPSRVAGRRYWQQMDRMLEPEEVGKPKRSLSRAVNHLIAAQRVVALTGAGVSTESGVPDYRSGIIAWTAYDPAELSYEAFLADESCRRSYWRMSQDFYVILRQAQPNRAHRALAELERLGKLTGIITQNVDRLHQRAGSKPERVVEIHGNEFGVGCLDCGARYSRDEIYRMILHGTEVPYCLHCQGLLKPDSIAFGQPMGQEESRRALTLIDRCDLLLVVGTSLNVEPVASLVARAAARGVRLIILNYGPTDFDAVSDVLLRGSAGALLDALVGEYKTMRAWVADSR